MNLHKPGGVVDYLLLHHVFWNLQLFGVLAIENCPPGWTQSELGICITVLSSPFPGWENADEQCLFMDDRAMLVNIYNREQNDAFAKIIPDGYCVWIGLSNGRDSSVWFDGSPVYFTRWHRSARGSGCACLMNDGMWYLRDCENWLFVACQIGQTATEKPTTILPTTLPVTTPEATTVPPTTEEPTTIQRTTEGQTTTLPTTVGTETTFETTLLQTTTLPTTTTDPPTTYEIVTVPDVSCGQAPVVDNSRISEASESNVTFQCFRGYRFDDDSTSKIIHCKSKRWSAISHCNRIHCPPLNMEFASATSNDTEVYTELVYRCGPNARLRSGENEVQIHCLETGLWSYSADCKEIPPSCDWAPPVKHANYTLRDGVHGLIAEYICEKGYVFPRNAKSKVLICLGDGRWHEKPPKTCELAICPEPESVFLANMTIIGGHEFVYNTEVIYECGNGTRFLDGATKRKIVCLETSQWSARVPPCEEGEGLVETIRAEKKEAQVVMEAPAAQVTGAAISTIVLLILGAIVVLDLATLGENLTLLKLNAIMMRNLITGKGPVVPALKRRKKRNKRIMKRAVERLKILQRLRSNKVNDMNPRPGGLAGILAALKDQENGNIRSEAELEGAHRESGSSSSSGYYEDFEPNTPEPEPPKPLTVQQLLPRGGKLLSQRRGVCFSSASNQTTNLCFKSVINGKAKQFTIVDTEWKRLKEALSESPVRSQFLGAMLFMKVNLGPNCKIQSITLQRKSMYGGKSTETREVTFLVGEIKNLRETLKVRKKKANEPTLRAGRPMVGMMGAGMRRKYR